jgi:surfeit locus 1 family protein
MAVAHASDGNVAGRAAQQGTLDSNEEAERAPRGAVALTVLGALALLGILGLTALGIWQVERRAWKLDLIARVDQRSHAAPDAAPGPAAWPAISRNGDEYRRVKATGRFLADSDLFVKAVTELGGGFWVLTPLRTDQGFTILVNRGFVAPDSRDTAAASLPAGEITITGLLRITEPKGAFLRANDPADQRWYSRDVAAMSGALRLQDAAPYFIDADATQNGPGRPRGGLTVVTFPNNHLIYAVTWFGLALMLVAGTWYVARHERRIRQRSLLRV